MPHGPDDPPNRPFTLVVCGSCRGGSEGDEVMESLRKAVQGSSHGVLVSTGCLGKLLDCRRRHGLYAAVQPCAVDRRPSGPVARLGPIANVADAEALSAWLRRGMPDDGTLPDRLRAVPSPAGAAHLN